jgi:hypothetical protein
MPHAGTDITRAMATLNMDLINEEWDDYSNLSEKQIEGVKNWIRNLAMVYGDKFYYVGNLVKDIGMKRNVSP